MSAAIKTATKAPVATCWCIPTAAFPLCVGEGEAPAPLAEVADSVAEDEGAEEVADDDDEAAAVAARASAVALRVPHCSFEAHTD